MPLANPTVTRPGQHNGTGAIDALHIEEITGEVQGTLERMSLLAPRVQLRPLRGTSTLTTHAVGKSSLGKIVVGQGIQATGQTSWGKTSVSVDTTIICREHLPLLEELQTSYAARAEIGQEQGKEHAKGFDQAFFIQAMKAGASTANTYGLSAGKGHLGATQSTFANALDVNDPALIYSQIVDLITRMREKDVDPISDGTILGVSHATMALLSMNEMLINSEFVTSDGTRIPQMVLKAHGLPIIPSNNFLGGQTVTGHLLSTAENGNAYDGDFTKVVGVAFSPKALLAAETIPLSTDVFFDKMDKVWYIDSWRAFGVAPRDVVHAGLLLKP